MCIDVYAPGKPLMRSRHGRSQLQRDRRYGISGQWADLPNRGCWEVAGEVDDTRVTFVTRVVKVGERK